jgi:hypothetical protein
MSLCAVVDAPTLRGADNDLRVLFERYAPMSEGMESYPHDGTMIAPDLLAAKS